MHYYTTLFDSFYLSRGLIMYRSLLRCTDDFHLYVFAFDDLSFNILSELSLRNMTAISLKDFETDELKEVKKTRTKAEYCWTCTPFVINYVIEKFKVPECTYVDSDLFFYSDPSVLISELDNYGKNVLITEHRYAFLPKLYEEKRSGRFCVQFMTFRNEKNSMEVLDTWQRQCIEWCYSRHENGKFGDQKYLDEWPGKYENVHILRHPGGGLAPWNTGLWSVKYKDGNIICRDRGSGNDFNPVFYHFQYVKPSTGGIYDIGWYNVPAAVKKIIYNPYLEDVERTESELEKKNSMYRRNYQELNSYYSGKIFKNFLKKVLKYNILKTA